ncbi:MAG: hypothetical protein AAGE65_07910 [Planctomycetota bacterium]
MTRGLPLLLAAVLVMSGCQTVELPGPDRPRVRGEFSKAELWKPAEGFTPDRMAIETASKRYFDVFRTVVQQNVEDDRYRLVWPPEADFLVCFQYPGVELFGTPYDVLVYANHSFTDHETQLIAHGTITIAQDAIPVAVVEVKIDHPSLPEHRRNKWQLAVLYADDHAFDSDDPQSWQLPHPSTEKRPHETPGFRGQLVAWKHLSVDRDDRFFEDLDTLLNLNQYRDGTMAYRTAEPNWVVNERGRIQR